MSAPALTVSIQGQGSVSADQLNTYVGGCDTIAQLRAFVGAPGVQVYVRGSVAVGDGGQGNFSWVPNVLGTDNNLSIIVPTAAATGYWQRITTDASTSDIISCTETGTNVLALTPINGVPQPFVYANYQEYAFVAQNTSTSTVTASVAGLPALAVFNPDNTAAGANALTAGRFYMIIFNQALAAGAGGFNLVFGAVAAGVTTIADAANGGLAFSANSGNITANIAPSDPLAKAAPVAADVVLIGDSAAAFAVKKSTIAQLQSVVGFVSPTVVVQDRKANTTVGSALTANTYTDRDLNTIILNTIGGATAVSTPNLTLPAGTYDVRAEIAVGNPTNATAFATRIFNTTGAAVLQDINANDIVSLSGVLSANIASGSAVSTLRARFTLSIQSNVKFQTFCNGAAANRGGSPVSSGEPEVYLSAEFVKVA